jgi:imidazolonepropionase-like amidohydrolase
MAFAGDVQKGLSMHARSVLVCAAVLGCGGRDVSTNAAAVGQRDTWIRDVTLVSPERPQPLTHAHVHLRGGRIAWIGTTRPPDLASGATEIDGTGRFLVPGLIDGHVHLSDVPGVPFLQQDALPRVVEAYFRQLPRSYLYFGFTTVIDLCVVDRKQIESLRAAPIGPAIFDCDGGVPIANGYPMAFAPTDVRFTLFSNFLYDPAQADAIPPAFRAADHTPAAAVGRIAKAGGICVKTYYEPGFGGLSGKLPVPSAELVGELVAAGRARRLPVLLHANSLAAHRFAVASKVAAVAHGLFDWQTEAPPGEMPQAVRQVLDDEVRTGVAMMPTHRIIEHVNDLLDPQFLADPHMAKVVPAELLVWYRNEGQAVLREMGVGTAQADALRQRIHVAGGAGRAATRYFAQHGGRLLFGSDTPSEVTYANPPGYNGFLELRALEGAGVSPRQILDAATRTNAVFFGIERDYGTIEPGKRDSLLLLRENPLASTSAFDTIELVIVRGQIVPRASLAATATR